MPDGIKEKEQAQEVPTESEKKGQENRRQRKRTRPRGSSSQTDDELPNEEHVQSGCTICNSKLDLIQEKLDKVLSLIPEVENLRSRIVQLEDKESMKQSRVYASRGERFEISGQSSNRRTG